MLAYVARNGKSDRIPRKVEYPMTDLHQGTDLNTISYPSCSDLKSKIYNNDLPNKPNHCIFSTVKVISDMELAASRFEFSRTC